ncbi:hypothetical protein AA536_004865, partial [Salmonella enterica subsp. enterica]|nr:hypothetical protein [Salmonella enterica subsp. enterica serovar Abaetetuba]
MATIQMGSIASGIHTGGDTNPEIFVDGITYGTANDGYSNPTEAYRASEGDTLVRGTWYPSALVFVNGKRGASTAWTMDDDGVDYHQGYHALLESSFGLRLHTSTGWNLSDAYYVNNWPGTPYT